MKRSQFDRGWGSIRSCRRAIKRRLDILKLMRKQEAKNQWLNGHAPATTPTIHLYEPGSHGMITPVQLHEATRWPVEYLDQMEAQRTLKAGFSRLPDDQLRTIWKDTTNQYNDQEKTCAKEILIGRGLIVLQETP